MTESTTPAPEKTKKNHPSDFVSNDIAVNNGRGLRRVEFIDTYGHACEIYDSSAACDRYLWLGIRKGVTAGPQIMAHDAKKLGLPTHGQSMGWVPFEIPKEVNMNDSLHLSVEQAKGLIKTLQAFVSKDEVKVIEPIRRKRRKGE